MCPVNPGNGNIHFVPGFKHVFGIDNIAYLNNDKGPYFKIHVGLGQFFGKNLAGKVNFAHRRNAMAAFREPQRFFVVETFFVGQPVAGFLVEQAEVYLFVGNADKVDNAVF